MKTLISKKQIRTLGFNCYALRQTLLNDTYSFDEAAKQSWLVEMAKPEIENSLAIDLIECIIAAIEERLDNSGELEMSRFEIVGLQDRKRNYLRTLNNLQKFFPEDMK